MKIKYLLPAFLASYACISSAQNLTAFDGPYIGIAAGWNKTSVSEGDVNWSAPSPATPATASGGQNSSASGGIVGINYGFNYRMKNLVLGGELSASMLSGTANGYAATTQVGGGATSISSSTQIKSLFAAKPKVGYVLEDNKTMLYGMAGVVVGEINRSITQGDGVEFLNTGTTVSSTKSNQFGYTLGAGIERMISEQLSIKFELNYVNLGNANFTYSGPALNSSTTATMSQNVKVTNMATTVGLNYKF